MILELFERCALYPELHFAPIRTQIQDAINQCGFDEDNRSLISAGNSLIYLGDFLITKHSNLISTHVVFHLVYDEDDLKEELNGRSDLIQGLKSILKLCHLTNITHISLPVCLAPYQHTLDRSKMVKRAGVVLKQTRSCFTEIARESSGEKVNRSVVFSIPDNKDGVYEDIKEELVTIFRTL